MEVFRDEIRIDTAVHVGEEHSADIELTDCALVDP